MGKLLIKTAIRSIVVALVFSAGVVTTANAEITRLSGADRYLTSDAIVKAGWPTGAETAILASGFNANRVDALTVAPLAKAKNAPVILVNPRELSVKAIVSKITDLNTKIVYIANGTGVFSVEVEEGLKAAGITTVRLGGANRYETALNIAKKLGSSTSVVVASGDDAHLVDSLSIAPIAAAKGMPIFLSGSSLDADTSAYIKVLGAKTTYVIGEADTVSEAIASMLSGVIRLAGSTRYETNAKVVDNFKEDTSLNLNNIFIASGEEINYIDALAGAPLAASIGAPIIFVHDTINSDINTLLRSVINATTKITTLGGVYAVTPLATYTIDTIQTGVDNNTAVTFPDKNLEQIVREQIRKPNGDILKSDVERITILLGSYKNIIDITGMENMINMGTLYLANNRISNIEPLKGMTNLGTAFLAYNQISNMEPLKGMSNLGYLDLSNNLISNLEPLKGLNKLLSLELSGNQINNLEPLKGLTKLDHLAIVNNQISNLEPLKALSNLSRLWLDNNQISKLDGLQGLTNLNDLCLSNNQIINLEPLRELTNLTGMDLRNNQIIDLEPLSNLTKLTSLILQNNQIINLEPLRKLTKLSWLKLENNQITDYTPIDFYHEVMYIS